jgi:hypothetical protein
MDLLAKTIVRSNGQIFRIIDGEAFLMTDDGRKVHMINKVGTLIWECANGSISVEDIIAKIMKRFDIDEDTATHDCLEFIRELVGMQLITIKDQVL